MEFKNIVKRKGIFSIPRGFFEERPNVLLRLMGKVLIVKAEANFMTDEIEYYAYSPLFDECQEGIMVPEYIIEHNGVDFMFFKK